MKTQKAKGIIKGLPSLFKELKAPAGTFQEEGAHYGYTLIHDEASLKKYAKPNPYSSKAKFPRFARPCPLNPAHGFVDSRKISSQAELEKMFFEVREVDSEGEIILARSYADIKSSLIFVDDGLLCVGPGNDGATSGHDSISFPVCPDKVNPKTKFLSGISEAESVYMEGIYAVGANYKWRLVQLRGGPEMICGSKDFIPEDTKVTKVVEPHDDLIAWANDVAAFKKGTVVYGAGHTMASHAAVHCILHNIPFITSFEPKVGSIAKATEEGKQPKISKEEFCKGAHVALKSDLWDMEPKRILYFCFSVLHNWAYLRNSDHASWLLGAAAAGLSGLCTALVLGEYRHAKSSRKPYRDTIYKRAMGTTSIKQLPKLTEAFKSFCYGNNWSGGFGGMKWGVCTHYTIKLYRALSRAYNSKGNTVSNREATSLLESFNSLVNLVHNGGWWFNKIAQQEDMNFCSEHPGLAAASVADIYYNLNTSVNKVKKFNKRLPVLPAVRPPLLQTDSGVKWARLDRNSMSVHSLSATVTVKAEDGTHSEPQKVKFTKAEFKKIMQDRRRRYFLRPKKGEGFCVPGGRVAISN